MPLVKEAVSLPFSTKKFGPAVLAWRQLNCDEARTGTPLWWAPMYARDPEVDPERQWDALMRACDAAELLDTLSESQGHKSPGSDGITIDALKLIADAPSSPSLLFLVSLVNAAFALAAALPHSRKVSL